MPLPDAPPRPCPFCGRSVRLTGRKSGERLTCPGCFAALTLNVTAKGMQLLTPGTASGTSLRNSSLNNPAVPAILPKPFQYQPVGQAPKYADRPTVTTAVPPGTVSRPSTVATKSLPVAAGVCQRVAPGGFKLNRLWGWAGGLLIVLGFAGWAVFSPTSTESDQSKGQIARVDVVPLEPAVPVESPPRGSATPPGEKLDEPRPASAPVAKRPVSAPVSPSSAPATRSNISADLPLTTRELVRLREPSVFRVLSPFGVGTGFVVKSSLIATNEHCIGQADLEDVYLECPSRLGSQYPDVTLAYAVPGTDLVVLRIAGLPESFEPIPILETAKLEKGERLVVIGNPGGLENVVTEGIFGSIQKLGPATFLQLSVAINPGNSGGPAFTDRGYLAGVVTLKSAKNEGIGFAIPGDVLRNALRMIEEKSAAELVQLGNRWRGRQAGSQLWFACHACQEIMTKYVIADQQSKRTGEKLDQLLAKIESETQPQRKTLKLIGSRIPDTLNRLGSDIDAADLTVLREMHERLEWARSRALRPQETWGTLEVDLTQLKRHLEDWKSRLMPRLGLMSFCTENVQTFSDAE